MSSIEHPTADLTKELDAFVTSVTDLGTSLVKTAISTAKVSVAVTKDILIPTAKSFADATQNAVSCYVAKGIISLPSDEVLDLLIEETTDTIEVECYFDVVNVSPVVNQSDIDEALNDSS
jgi:dynactin complex subunit